MPTSVLVDSARRPPASLGLATRVGRSRGAQADDNTDHQYERDNQGGLIRGVRGRSNRDCSIELLAARLSSRAAKVQQALRARPSATARSRKQPARAADVGRERSRGLPQQRLTDPRSEYLLIIATCRTVDRLDLIEARSLPAIETLCLDQRFDVIVRGVIVREDPHQFATRLS